MDLDANQKELIELFVKQEVLIGTLYKHFSERYPEYKRFWKGMSVEEFQHADLIQRITETDSLNNIIFSQGELRTTSISSSVKYLEDLITEFTENMDFPIARAAIVALQLEKGLWEKKVFQCFEGDSDDVMKIMDSLNGEQKIHISKIHKFASKFMKFTLEDRQSKIKS